jgi:hypothetical protein
MPQLEGLAVGGPLDGKLVVSDCATLRAAELPETSTMGFGRPLAEAAGRAYTTYSHVDFHGTGFWVPEGRSGQWAMNEVLRAYQERGYYAE